MEEIWYLVSRALEDSFIAEFGVHLAELTVDPNGPLAIRQLASVLLKQYVEAHWSQNSDKFRAPETTEAVSNQVSRLRCKVPKIKQEFGGMRGLACLSFFIK